MGRQLSGSLRSPFFGRILSLDNFHSSKLVFRDPLLHVLDVLEQRHVKVALDVQVLLENFRHSFHRLLVFLAPSAIFLLELHVRDALRLVQS